MAIISSRTSYAEVARVPGAKSLLVMGVLARLPIGMLPLALLLLIQGRSGSFSAAGLAVGLFALSGAVASPVLGTAVDRLGQTAILLVSAAVQTALLATLVAVATVGAPVAVLVVLAALAGLSVPPIAACARSLWPRLLSNAAQRESAYTLDAISQEVIWISGPLTVSGIVAASSASVAVVVAAAITLGGTLVFAALPASRAFHSQGVSTRFGKVLASPSLRPLLLTIGLFGMAIGTIEVGFPALAHTWGSRTDGGLMLALASVGSALGGLLYGIRTWERGVVFRYPIALIGGALALLPLVLANSLAAGLVLSLLAGVPIAPIFSCQSSLTASLAPVSASTEAFMWNLSALICGVALGSALGGSLAQSAGVGACFALGSGACAVGSATVLIRRGRRIEPTGFL